MNPDTAAAVLRALSNVALVQAAGAALFLWGFREILGSAVAPVRRFARWAAAGAVVLLFAHECAEVTRLTGEYSGVWDPDMQRLAWTSHGGIVHGVQIAALALLAGVLAVGGTSAVSIAALAALTATAAYAGAGHTSVHPLRLLLAPLLVLHVSVGAFWFGALAPLAIILRRGPAREAHAILVRFSRIAGWLVPAMAVAGVAMATVLVPGWSVFGRPYGELLAVKAAAFCALLAFAADNRWRATPALAAGDPTAGATLLRSIAAESVLLVAALTATAVLTTFFSPEE